MSTYRPDQTMSTFRERLLELALAVENDGDWPAFDMSIYAGPCLQVYENRVERTCNSVACIAGTAVYLWDRPTFDRYFGSFSTGSIKGSAQRLLGLSLDQSDALFVPDDYVMRRVNRHHAAAMLRWLADDRGAHAAKIKAKWCELIGAVT